MNTTRIIYCFLTLLAGSVFADVPGSKDHPLISRYSGSEIIGYKEEEYGETEFPLGPAYLRDGRRGFSKTERAEGRRTRILYMAPAQRTSLEVMRNYQEALSKAGAKILFQCAGASCGTQVSFPGYSEFNNPRKLLGEPRAEYAFSMNVEDERYITAKISRPDAEVYVSVLTAVQQNAADMAAGKRVAAFLEIVEGKVMDRGMVTINAEALKKGLATEGKIALYGIYFDTDKAELKPESRPQLDEMVALLKSNPKLKVYIVGHTDNQGSLDYNRNLSQRRAEAVSKALTAQGVEPSRMAAYGVANLAPVASNSSEKGRALNRRVELVEQ